MRADARPEHRLGPGQQLDGRAGQHLEADQRRTGLTGKTHHRHLLGADRTEPEGRSGIEGHLCEGDRPGPAAVAAGQDAAHHVTGAGAGAAGGDDQVGPQCLVLQQATQRLRVVVADPHPVRERARLRRRGGQRVRVGVHHLTGLAAPAHVHQFVAGGHDHHARAGPHHDVPDAGGGEHRDQSRGHVRPGAGEQRAGDQFLPGAAQAVPPFGGAEDLDGGHALVGPLHRDDHVGADRQRRARRHREAGAGGEPHRPPAGSAQVTDHVEPDAAATGHTGGGRDVARPPTPTGDVLPARGVSVHRRLVEGGVRVRGDHVLGEHVAVRLGQVEVEWRQRA